MSLYEITFSPTGGTNKVSEVIISELGTVVHKIDLLDKNKSFCNIKLTKEDVCVISVPSFGGRMPAVAKERLSLIKGEGASAIATIVYGNRAYEDTLIELYDVLTDAGFRCIAGICAISEHSIMRQYASGRPDSLDVAVLKDFAKKINDNINSDNKYKEFSIPGNRPYKELGTIPMHPKAGSSCKGCGLCAKECPVGAIDPSNVKACDSKKCISCMRCVSVCPTKSRAVNKVILAGASQKLKKACSIRKENELFI